MTTKKSRFQDIDLSKAGMQVTLLPKWSTHQHLIKPRKPPPRAHLVDYVGEDGKYTIGVDYAELETRMLREQRLIGTTTIVDGEEVSTRVVQRPAFRKLRALTRTFGIKAHATERDDDEMLLTVPTWFERLLDEAVFQEDAAPTLGRAVDRIEATLRTFGTRALEATHILGGQRALERVLRTTVSWVWAPRSRYTHELPPDEDECSLQPKVRVPPERALRVEAARWER